MNEMVNIRQLKAIALKIDEPLKTLILSEQDTIPREEYLIKIQSWLRLLNLNQETRKEGSS